MRILSVCGLLLISIGFLPKISLAEDIILKVVRQHGRIDVHVDRETIYHFFSLQELREFLLKEKIGRDERVRRILARLAESDVNLVNSTTERTFTYSEPVVAPK